MGACSFRITDYGYSATEVFNRLVEDAKTEYGEDGYNGTISTTDFCGIKKKFDKPTSTNEKKAREFVNKHIDEIYKRDCCCVDLGIDHYDVITVKKESSKKATPSFKKMFVVHYESSICKDKTKAFSTKKGAEDFAIKEKLSNPDSDVFVNMEYVLTKGDNSVSTMKVEITQKKTMSKSLKLMPNRIVKPVHKYIFYGWAAE